MFEEAFAPYGLKDDWFSSAYGLAESVVYVTHLNERRLSKFQPTEGVECIAVGHMAGFPEGQTTKVVCPETCREMGEQQVGELWLSGPSVTAGYFGKADLSAEVFNASIADSDCNLGFLRTGDLAFFEDGYLYICGRQKDLVIVNGVNYYPQDIEHVVENASSAVRPGCIAAFSSDDLGGDGDLEVVFELRAEFAKDVVDIVTHIRGEIIKKNGIMPKRIVAIKDRTILKTTSGKIKRKANRQALHSNSLQVLHEVNGTQQPQKQVTANPTKIPYDHENDNKQEYDEFDEIMVTYFGYKVDYATPWNELGLTSMMSIQLRDAISDSFAITLNPECFEVHKTPDALKRHVLGNQGTPLDVSCVELEPLTQVKLSWAFMGLLQGMGTLVILALFAFSIVPAWFFGRMVVDLNGYSTIKALGTDIDIIWVWIPIAVPVWMLSFSLLVVALKWLVVWKYREGVVSVPSPLYFRWWVVDRAVSFWEYWVGRFVLNTPLIKFFYILMGAKIHSSASIEAFVREFDLVSIGEDTSLQFQVHCRKYGNFEKNREDFASLRFRSTSIGASCIVKGMVSPGASVGDDSFVECLAVVQEGAQVPTLSYVTGNPAYLLRQNSSAQMKRKSSLLGVLKMVWLVFEVYLFFGVMLLGQYLWMTRLPNSWRYAELLKWTLLLLWFSFMSICTSIIIKWTFIGKRKPGQFSDSLWRDFADWAADWHFQVATGLLISVSTHSRFWNVVLMMHGMDIDFTSRIAGVGCFVPSKVDLITVKNSFISVANFNVKSSNCYYRASIVNSSVGLLVQINPTKSYLNVIGSIVPPMSLVSDSIVQFDPDSRAFVFTTWQLFGQEVEMSILYLISFCFLFGTLVPSYELWVVVFNNPNSIWVAVDALTCALALQTVVWSVLIALVQRIALIPSISNSSRPFRKTIYSLYGTMVFAYQTYSCLALFMGSPVFNFVMSWVLGVKFEGRAILSPFRMYEHSSITVADKTIVDSSQITGHYAVYGEVTLGPTRLQGVLHEGSYVANATINSTETESWRAVVGRNDGNSNRTSFTFDEKDDCETDEELGLTSFPIEVAIEGSYEDI